MNKAPILHDILVQFTFIQSTEKSCINSVFT